MEKLISFGRMPYKNIFSPQTDEDREAIERALVCTNLQSKRDKPIYALSGGEATSLDRNDISSKYTNALLR